MRCVGVAIIILEMRELFLIKLLQVVPLKGSMLGTNTPEPYRPFPLKTEKRAEEKQE